MLFCYFFFFKQKTAYEVRISDWSSDVCSSDLSKGALVWMHLKSATTSPLAGPTNTWRRSCGCRLRISFSWRLIPGTRWELSQPGGEIGRASCRERVCQYV